MRVAKTFDDVNIMFKELFQWKDRLSSKNQDFHGLKIQNAGDATEPADYVTLRQLPSIPVFANQREQHFSIPFSSSGTVTTGQLSAPFIVGVDRVGMPTGIAVAVPTVAQAPVSQDLIINVQLNGANILATNLTLPIGKAGPVFSSILVTPTPILSVGAKLTPVVVQGDGVVSFVTIQLYVTRIFK